MNCIVTLAIIPSVKTFPIIIPKFKKCLVNQAGNSVKLF